MLGQGVTEPKRELGMVGAHAALADKAAQLREYCGALAEHGFTEHQITALARKVAPRFVHFLVPGTLLIVSAAPLILIPFGEDYVREGTPVVRVLACACVFQATIVLTYRSLVSAASEMACRELAPVSREVTIHSMCRKVLGNNSGASRRGVR